MSIYLSHREALHRARQAGRLVAWLQVPPDLVIGIRRSGLPVAIAFAQGAGAARIAFVTRHAGTRPVTPGALLRWGRRLVPRRLRQLGKSLLYRRVMLLITGAQQPPAGTTPFIEEHAQLRGWLTGAAGQSVVVVDDAIDTGVTMRQLVDTIQSVDPRHLITTFALTSTLGLEVHERQHHLFEDVVEYLEGDLGLLSEAGAAQVLAGLPPLSAAGRARASGRLEVTLPELLVRPPEDCAARALARALAGDGRRAAALGLRIRYAVWRLGQTPSGDVMAALEHRCRALSDAGRDAFGETLATELRAARQPLVRDRSALAVLDVRVGHRGWLAAAAARALDGAAILPGD